MGFEVQSIIINIVSWHIFDKKSLKFIKTIPGLWIICRRSFIVPLKGTATLKASKSEFQANMNLNYAKCCKPDQNRTNINKVSDVCIVGKSSRVTWQP